MLHRLLVAAEEILNSKVYFQQEFREVRQEVHHQEACCDGNVDVNDHQNTVGLNKVSIDNGKRNLNIDHHSISCKQSSKDKLEKRETV